MNRPNQGPDNSSGGNSQNPNHWVGADIAWSHVPDDDDDDEVLELEPIDPDASFARAQMRDVPSSIPVTDPVRNPPPESPTENPLQVQYSLSWMMLGMTMIALVMGLMQWVSPNLFAGTLGILVFVGIVVSAVVRIDEPKVVVGWWIVVFLYVISTISALIGIGS